MSLLNTTLVGDVLPGGVAGELADGSIDTTQVIDELLPSLHADSRANLTFWTEGDLIQWMDEALKRLARKAAVFVGVNTQTLSVPWQAQYALPEQHVSTIHVSFAGVALRPASILELEARDPDFPLTPGIPDHWYENLLGLDSIGLAPVPDTADLIVQVYEGWPAELDAGRQQTLTAAPAPLKGYLAMSVLASAYAKEGEAETPDIAQHCKARVEMLEKIFASFYGAGK